MEDGSGRIRDPGPLLLYEFDRSAEAAGGMRDSGCRGPCHACQPPLGRQPVKRLTENLLTIHDHRSNEDAIDRHSFLRGHDRSSQRMDVLCQRDELPCPACAGEIDTNRTPAVERFGQAQREIH
jgi:hypothetical protein